MLEVVIVTPQRVLFKGPAHQVVLPGEEGVFEVWPFHRPIVSRLVPGLVIVDSQPFVIQHGVVKVVADRLTAIVESA